MPVRMWLRTQLSGPRGRLARPIARLLRRLTVAPNQESELWIAVLAVSFGVLACTNETEPEREGASTATFHVDSDVPARVELDVRNRARNYTVSVEFPVPGNYTLPLPWGMFTADLNFADTFVYYDEFCLETRSDHHDLYLDFVRAVVTTQLPEIYSDRRVGLNLRGPGRRMSALAQVGADGRAKFEFPFLRPGRYFPELSGLDTSGSCPADSLNFEVGDSIETELSSAVPVSWQIHVPWESSVDLATVSFGRFLDFDVPLDWQNGVTTVDVLLPCGSEVGIELDPPRGKSISSPTNRITGSVETIWHLGGIELEINGLKAGQESLIQVGDYAERFDGPISTRWLLLPGSYLIRYRPGMLGLMPPPQSFPPLLVVGAEKAVQVQWELAAGGTIEGEFLHPLEEADGIWLRSDLSSSGQTWHVELEPDRLGFAIEHVPIDSFLVQRARKVEGRTVAWWYPGTFSRHDAVRLFVAAGDTLTGIAF